MARVISYESIRRGEIDKLRSRNGRTNHCRRRGNESHFRKRRTTDFLGAAVCRIYAAYGPVRRPPKNSETPYVVSYTLESLQAIGPAGRRELPIRNRLPFCHRLRQRSP